MVEEPSEVKNALSKITETESLIPKSVIPESTKVISSLFGKLSKFTMHQEEAEQTEDEKKFIESPSKKAKSISINAFYEDLFTQARIGQLDSNFENYSSSHKVIDSATLNLVSKHYRFQVQNEESYIDWSILKDILSVILQEDTTLAFVLLLAHKEDWLEMFQKREGLGLYLASLRSTLKCLGPCRQTKAFDFPPGFLYCYCKTFMYHDDELFAKALTLLNEDAK